MILEGDGYYWQEVTSLDDLANNRREFVKGEKIQPPAVQLWICGKVANESENGQVWEFRGIYDDLELARFACKGPDWFVAPVMLNQDLPAGTAKWEGCFYPIRTECQ